MNKNFIRLKKDLKSFAKRVNNFKYTDRILVVFLLTGSIGTKVNLFSAQADNIENQVKAIKE